MKVRRPDPSSPKGKSNMIHKVLNFMFADDVIFYWDIAANLTDQLTPLLVSNKFSLVDRSRYFGRASRSAVSRSILNHLVEWLRNKRGLEKGR